MDILNAAKMIPGSADGLPAQMPPRTLAIGGFHPLHVQINHSIPDDFCITLYVCTRNMRKTIYQKYLDEFQQLILRILRVIKPCIFIVKRMQAYQRSMCNQVPHIAPPTNCLTSRTVATDVMRCCHFEH